MDIVAVLLGDAFNVISDGLETRVGTITSDYTRYMAWKSENGENSEANASDLFTVLLNGMFQKIVEKI